MENYVIKPSRISEKAREFALSFFIPNGPKLAKCSEDDLPLHAAALCLYSTMLLTQIHENLPQIHDYFSGVKNNNFDCDQRVRQLRSKIHEKNPELTQQEINQKTEEYLSADIRNAFAHGRFNISFDKNGQPIFILSTAYKNEPSNASISISFEELFRVTLAQCKSFSSNIPSKEVLVKQLDDYSAEPQVLQNYVFPDILLHMATFFYNRNYYLSEEKEDLARDPVYFRCLQLILLDAMFAYTQNDAYLILPKDSPIFKKMSVIRTSLVHSMIEFVNGTGIKIKTQKEKYIGLVRPQSELRVHLMEAEMLLTQIDIAKTDKQLHFSSVPEEDKPAVREVLSSSGITPENAEEKKKFFQSVLKKQQADYNQHLKNKILMAIKWFEENKDKTYEMLEEEELSSQAKNKSNADGEGK